MLGGGSAAGCGLLARVARARGKLVLRLVKPLLDVLAQIGCTHGCGSGARLCLLARVTGALGKLAGGLLHAVREIGQARQRGLAQLLTKLSALLAQTVELLEHSGKIESRTDGNDHIGKECGQPEHIHREQRPERQRRDHPFDRPVNKARQNEAEKTPAQRGLQADIASELKPVLGIVPVFHLKQFFHHNADNILEYRRGGHAREKKCGRPVVQRQRNVQQEHRAEAIDRQHRPAQKAAVDEMALFDRHDRRFEAPSQYTVQEEYQQPLRSGIAVTHCFSSFQRRVSSCGGITIFYLIF